MAQYIDSYNIFQKISHAYRITDNALNLWNRHIVSPYVDAYDFAYKNYLKTLKEAEEAEKQRAELAFLALSLCGGSLLASAVALSMRSAISSYALKVICNNNMNRTFEMVHYASNSNAIKFAIAGAIGALGNEASIAIKKSLEDNVKGGTSLKLMEPWKMADSMRDFTNHSRAIAQKALSFAESGDLSMRERGLIYKNVINSQFMRPPVACPYGEQITEDSSIVKEIELGFYMRLIMNSDNLKKRASKATSIDISPSDSNYPKTIGMGRGQLQAVSFDRLEQPVVDRINELHKGVTQKKEMFIDSKWLGERMDKATLIQAEKVLIDLGKKSDKYRTQGTPLIVDPKVQGLQ